MTRVFVEDSTIRVPGWVVDLESFRRWSDDDDFPEAGRVSFLEGEVWIDMSRRRLWRGCGGRRETFRSRLVPPEHRSEAVNRECVPGVGCRPGGVACPERG